MENSNPFLPPTAEGTVVRVQVPCTSCLTPHASCHIVSNGHWNLQRLNLTTNTGSPSTLGTHLTLGSVNDSISKLVIELVPSNLFAFPQPCSRHGQVVTGIIVIVWWRRWSATGIIVVVRCRRWSCCRFWVGDRSFSCRGAR
jgi:hypothetical protein